MNTRNLLRFGGATLALFGAAHLATAQVYQFDIPDLGNSGVHQDQGLDLSVYGTVNFLTGEITATLTNDSAVASRVTGIWFLKPVSGDVVDGVTVDPNTFNLSDDWTAVNALTNSVSNILNNDTTLADNDDYFGADAGSNDGVWSDPVPAGGTNSLTFDFSLAAGVDFTGLTPEFWNLYATSQYPHVVVRWQSVGDDGQLSGAGWGSFLPGGDTPPIPEPSTVAFMAMAGLGGALYLRRRLTRKGA